MFNDVGLLQLQGTMTLELSFSGTLTDISGNQIQKVYFFLLVEQPLYMIVLVQQLWQNGFYLLDGNSPIGQINLSNGSIFYQVVVHEQRPQSNGLMAILV